MSMTLSLVLLHLSIAIISMSFWLSPPDPSPGKALQSYNHFLFPANFSVKNFVIPFPALSPQALLKSECKGSDFPHYHQTFPQLFFQYFFKLAGYTLLYMELMSLMGRMGSIVELQRGGSDTARGSGDKQSGNLPKNINGEENRE